MDFTKTRTKIIVSWKQEKMGSSYARKNLSSKMKDN